MEGFTEEQKQLLQIALDRLRKARYAWADLLRRVFALEVLECPDCGGRVRILAAIHPPEATRAILECLGLPSRAPPTATARPDPESPDKGRRESTRGLAPSRHPQPGPPPGSPTQCRTRG